MIEYKQTIEAKDLRIGNVIGWRMSRRMATLILCILMLSSCSLSQRVVTRQKDLMANHKAKREAAAIKKDHKKTRQAFTVSVFVFLVWFAAKENYQGE